MTTRSCPACGAVVPKRIGRCPSCGAGLGRRLMIVGLPGAFLAVIAVWIFIWMRNSAPRLTVQITPAIVLRSPDERGTDASAMIENPNPVPVDVTIRVRGFDISDRPVIEKTIGPFYHLPAGGSRPIQAYLDTTPLKSVTFEAIAVKPVDSSNRP